MMGGLGFGILGLGVFIMFAFWALVIGGAIGLVVTFARGSSAGSSASALPVGQTPLDIVKARNARGEISREQFDAMKHDQGA